MMWQQRAPGCLFLLTSVSIFQLSYLSLTNGDSSHQDIPLGLSLSGDEQDNHPVKGVHLDDKDELFGDMDPQQLADILVASLKGKEKAKSFDEDSARDEELRDAENNRSELEMLLSAQRQQRDQEPYEEEEKLTENVASRTTSQIVPVQTQPPPAEPTAVEVQEEQLTQEELQSLETVMKEFPRLSTFEKREDGRMSSSYNEVLPMNKNLDKSKQKLMWQEETQKGMNFPVFGGRSFFDESENSNSVMDYTGRPEQEGLEEPQTEEEDGKEEMDEEVLSPEEEEARAQAEQDEMRRQAAEAQRAKMEEEKLADIASDMLLRYMGKDSQRKYSFPVSDAAEDKRSDEEPPKEENDLDPQTIDKLIEISSKLHLPADDVVDIISDVEKKKRKDVAPDMSHWKPLSMPVNNVPAPEPNKNSYPPNNRLKTWFNHKMADSQDLWSKPKKPALWSKNGPERFLKAPVYWTGQRNYPMPHPAYYQRRPFPVYYPLHLQPPPRVHSRYYAPRLYTPKNVWPYPANNAYGLPQQPHFSPSWLMLRKQIPYYTNKAASLSLNPWKFQPKTPIPNNRRMPLQKHYFMSTPTAGNEAYQSSQKDNEMTNTRDNLEKYIQQLVLKRARMLQ